MLQRLTERLLEREDMTRDEAEQALEVILQPDCRDSDIAAFLTALHRKGETPAEVAGFSTVMRRHSLRIRCDSELFVDTAGTGGGRESFNISTTAAFVISGAGLAVAKHGNRAVTSRSGSADVLTALGVRIDMPVGVSERCLNEFGVAFLFAPMFHPAMKRVVQVRKALDHRTIFNLLGPLTNPAGAPFQVVGVYSPNLTEKLARSLSLLGSRRAWVVHGRDGMDELSACDCSDVSEIEEGNLRSFSFDPRTFGFPVHRGAGYPAGDADENARTCLGILGGEMTGPARDVVVLNSAAALHVAGEADFRVALERAIESIDSGAALEKLHRLVEASAGSS